MQGRPKILVVDDEPHVLQSTEMILGLLGYEAVPLADPTEVVEVAAREKPVLILQDLKMAHLDLPRLVRRLQSNEATRTIPIVFFSAIPELGRIAADLHRAGILSKPLGSDQVARAVQEGIVNPRTEPVRAGQAGSVEMEKELDDLFHEYWNVFTSVATTAQVLAHGKSLTPHERGIVDQIDRLLIKIEREADGIRGQLRSYLVAPRAR